MEKKQTLGKFIISKRKEAGLTQKNLADKLFVTESAVSKWERGLSYPDITMISDLCATLNITEHELVTASDDLRQRQVEKQAKTYRNITNTTQWIFNLSYITAIVTCFICNLAVNHTLSWFFIVLTSVLLAFTVTSMPPLIRKHRGAVTLGAFTVALGLLLMVCNIYTGGNWFFISFVPVLYSFVLIFLPIVLPRLELPAPFCNHKALICFIADTVLTYGLVIVILSFCGRLGRFFPFAFPVMTVSLAVAWLFLIAIRYLPVNGLFKTAICLFITTGSVAFINEFVNAIYEKRAMHMSPIDLGNFGGPCLEANINFVIVASFALLALLFTIGGIALQLVRAKKNRD